MAQESLRRTTTSMQPVKAYVEGCMHSNKKDNVFCLVEAPFDMKIYSERLSEKIDVRVAYSEDLKRKPSRGTVEQFVKDLRSKFANVRVFGIRDVDYSEYISQQMPEGVFGTDERDLEMMILHSSSFSAYLEANMPNYQQVMDECLAACRCLGYIRIYDEHIGRKCKINKKVKISTIYDSQNHMYKENYNNVLLTLYTANCEIQVTIDQINEYKVSQGLENECLYRVCRGHDVLSLLGIVLGNKFHEPEMHNLMIKYYSKDDFYNTSLFNNIDNYCNTFGIDAKC